MLIPKNGLVALSTSLVRYACGNSRRSSRESLRDARGDRRLQGSLPYRRTRRPLRERRVGRTGDALAFVALGNEFEEHGRFRLIAALVAEIVQDQKIKTVELGEFLCESQIAARNLQPLYKIAASCKEYAPTGIDKRMANAADEMTFPDAGAPKARCLRLGRATHALPSKP